MEKLDATPKLLLTRLPSKAKEPIIMQTPPVNKLAAIPFQWEEAPGKPRATSVGSPQPPHSKIPVARCLDLPPRLLNNVKVSNVASSPTTLHDSLCSCSCQSSIGMPASFDLYKGSIAGLEDGKRQECEGTKRLKIGSSWSWGSFKGISGVAWNDGSMRNHKSGVKISRVRRRSSFFKISQSSSNLWAGIYGSFKQVVPWRWRQQ